MKKYTLLVCLVIIFGIYVFWNKEANSASATQPIIAETGTSNPNSISDETVNPSSDGDDSAATETLSFASDIGFGSTGTEVSALQQLLIANGYLSGISAPTGFFGQMTWSALQKFQVAHQISPALGFLDLPTRRAIGTVSGATEVAATQTSSTVTTGATGSGIYKDGTYEGSVADAYFGNLQVEAVVKSGALVDCIPLTYPSDSGHSLQISNTALPVLKQEAIKAQSANVNIVSGATQTSEAFQQSLKAALASAKN